MLSMTVVVQEEVVLLLRGLSKGDGKLVGEDGLRLPPKRSQVGNQKVSGRLQILMV